MPRERFGSILRFLHFVDNNSAPPREEDRHRLFKIRPVIEELRRQFQLNYILSREISINETMVKFKGRKFFRRFLPSKPIRFGFKLFTLAESKSGYIWNFEIYTGRKGEAEENQTNTVAHISKLIRKVLFAHFHLFSQTNQWQNDRKFKEMKT